MIKIVADNFVKADSKKKFLEIAEKLIDATRKETGNISYFLHEDLKDENHLTFMEEWQDEKAIKEHNISEHFTEYVPQLAKYCEKPGTCFLYSKIDL